MSSIIHDAALTAIQEDVLLNCGGFIWECIAPLKTVPACSYKYTVFDNSTAYKIPQTKLAGCAYPNEIECVTFETKTRETEEHFLDKYICNRDLSCFNASNCNSPTFDWVARQQRNLFNKLLLRHEYDVISQAFDATKYQPFDADAKVKNGQCADMATDIGGQPWDPAFNLLEKLSCCLDNMYPRATHAVMSRRTLNALRRHPDFLGAGCVVSSIADTSVVEDYLGVRLCISDAVYDAAPFGAPQDIRCFLEDKILFFTQTDGSVGLDCGDANFGWTAQWQQTFAGRIPCPKRGGRGGFYIRGGWDKDVYFNHNLGFLIKGIENKQP